MASPAKSSRSRKLPSPNGRNQDLSTNSGRNYNKNHKQEENGLGDTDALSAYVPGMWLLNFYIIKYFKNHNGKYFVFSLLLYLIGFIIKTSFRYY